MPNNTQVGKQKDWKNDTHPEVTPKTTTDISREDWSNLIPTGTIEGYDFNKRNYSGDHVISTKTTKNPNTNEEETRNISTKTFNVSSTKIVTRKIKNSEGEVVGTVTKKVKTSNLSDTPTKVTTTTVRRGGGDPTKDYSPYSDSSSNANQLHNNEHWGDWYETSSLITTSKSGKVASYDDYAKTKTGVVKNTSNSAYDAAREAKKLRVAEEKANEEARIAVNVLKNEVPADIAELKSLVKIIMDQLGLIEDLNDMNDDDFVEIEEAKKQNILIMKGIIGDFVANVLAMYHAVPAEEKPIMKYSDAQFKQTFMDNRTNPNITDLEYSQRIADFINKLVDDNAGFVYLSGASMVGAESNDRFLEWGNYAKNYIKHFFIANGCPVPTNVPPPGTGDDGSGGTLGGLNGANSDDNP